MKELLKDIRDVSLLSTRAGKAKAIKISKQLAKYIIGILPESKRDILDKALDRNLYLTSVRTLSYGLLKVYEEGFYLELEGTRSSFKVFVKDFNGDLEVIRKPVNLHILYHIGFNMNEDDYIGYWGNVKNS